MISLIPNIVRAPLSHQIDCPGCGSALVRGTEARFVHCGMAHCEYHGRIFEVVDPPRGLNDDPWFCYLSWDWEPEEEA